jgi:transglutaminase-like putative cysteine protease
MTAGTATATAPAPGMAALARLPFRPAEGFLTVFASVLMILTFAGSLVDARWTTARVGPPEFLLWIGPLGVAMGLLGAKIGWGRWRTHVIGALFAGIMLPLIAGGLVLERQIGPVGWDPQGLALRMAAASRIGFEVWNDLVVLRRPFTGQEGHYHMVFGAMVWGAGLLTGFTVFGHRRPLDAVVVVGLALLANMALTARNPGTQLTMLVLFSAAALLLLIRTHVFEEEVTWTRRRIGDPGAVGQLYLRGGAAFVTVAVIGSIVLTMTASSAPLQGLWKDLPQNLQDLSQFLQKIAPGGGDFRNTGSISFGGSVITSGVWNPSSETAFQAQLQPSEDRDFKWRAGTYSFYTGFGWEWGTTSDVASAARDVVLPGQGDEPSPVGRRPLVAVVIPDGFRDQTVVGPNEIETVDHATVGKVVGADGWLSRILLQESSTSYSITALVPVFQDVSGGLTQARLRAAGTDYPAELKAIYTQLPEGALGPRATEVLNQIKRLVRVPEGADPNNPYDLARTMESYLSRNFAYNANVKELRDTQCAGVSSTECFAIIGQGYCEYYATAMAVMLRAQGVPARIAYGFLHGERTSDGREIVEGSSAHWWVEAYFPGSGWVEFDPTGGGVGQPVPLPSGSVGPSTPRPSRPSATFPGEPSEAAGGPTGPSRATPTGIGPFIVITLILAIGIGALAFASYRRTPSKPMHPDQAWGSLGRLATRFGLGPRPSQTVFEYAGALADEVPSARIELTTIARAKVEVAYGRQELAQDRLKRIALAYHRLRFALLSVVFRRGLRRRRKR